MGDNEKTREPDVPSATDAEVASAAKQLGLKVGGHAVERFDQVIGAALEDGLALA